MRGIIWLEITLCHVTKRVCGLHSENAVTFLFGLSTAQFPITHKRCTDSNLLLLVYTRQYPSAWHRCWNMASFHNINALAVHVMSYWYRKSICGDKTSLRLFFSPQRHFLYRQSGHIISKVYPDNLYKISKHMMPYNISQNQRICRFMIITATLRPNIWCHAWLSSFVSCLWRRI